MKKLKIVDNVDLEELARIYNLDRDLGGLYYAYVPFFKTNIKKGTILRIDIKRVAIIENLRSFKKCIEKINN